MLRPTIIAAILAAVLAVGCSAPEPTATSIPTAITGPTVSPVSTRASIDEYAAWCKGLSERVDERLEDHDGIRRWSEVVEWFEANELGSAEKLTAAQEKEFAELFPDAGTLWLDVWAAPGSVLVEEWKSIVPPNELADLHSTTLVLMQVFVTGERRDSSQKERADLVLARRGVLEEVKNNLTPGEYARVAGAGCLAWDALLRGSLLST